MGYISTWEYITVLEVFFREISTIIKERNANFSERNVRLMQFILYFAAFKKK